MAIGKRIKIAIREEGISIKELAEKVGVSVNTLYSVTKRDSERIDSITLERISAVLGLPVTFFKSEPPFEDLASLEIKKTALLEMIAESGYEDLGNPESFSEFPDIQFWRLVGKYIIASPNHENDSNSWLMNLEEIPEIPSNKVTEKEASLLALFRDLNEEGQEKAIAYLIDLTCTGKYQKDTEV